VARIRSIKPEFWTSEQVMECSTNARLMFIGMWNFADDCGRLPYSPKTIKAQIFQSDDINAEDVRRLLDELSSNGLIIVYSVEDKEYIEISGWKHQKIDRPQAPKYPAPFFDGSTIIRRALATDRKGEDRKGEDSAAVAAPEVVPISPEVEYFRRIKEVAGPSAGGLGKKLLDAKGGVIPLARAAVEQASTKENAKEYLAAIIRRGSDPPANDDAARGRSW